MQLEMSKVMNDPDVNFSPLIFLTNAGAAFALNMSVFMLIGRTSALTMNVAGVIKVRYSRPLLQSPRGSAATFQALLLAVTSLQS